METPKYVRSYQLLENLKSSTLTLLSIIKELCCWKGINNKKNPVGAELQFKHS